MSTLESPRWPPTDETQERLDRLETLLEVGAEERSNRALAVALGLLAVAGALIIGIVLFTAHSDGASPVEGVVNATAPSGGQHMAGMDMGAGDAGNVAVEPYKRPDPALPAVPAGEVKRFRMEVYEHVTQVSDDLPPTKVWSYAVNGVAHRGTGVSTPMVVHVGDRVRIDLVNGSGKAFKADFPHSVDFHAAEVAPNKDYATIAPGQRKTFSFVAEHPGVFMYHCATDPVLMHTGAGMVGAMIVKPRNLAPVDHEYWITQQEYYIGRAGAPADMGKMEAMQPDVVAFNGYADQYKAAPIQVVAGEKVRLYVLNAGPSLWSAFHVIGTVFDRTVIEGQRGHDAQTVNLAPSQGGWVEFSLDAPGTYPFLDHSFAGMMKGAAGAFQAVPKGAAS